jgi:hypothetical protein
MPIRDQAAKPGGTEKMAVEQQEEITDVALCYQSLGVPLDASPERIEQVYKSLTDGYRKKLSSPDAVLREEARVSLELLQVMYDKIRASVTYRTMERDYLKKAPSAQAPARPVHKVVAENRNMFNCPRCNGLISKTADRCPICKSPIYGPVERVLKELFTVKRVIAFCIIVAVLVFAAMRVMHPELFTEKENTDIGEGLEK